LGVLPRAVLIITIGLITAVATYQATATDVFTDPVGFITVSAEGTTGHGGATASSFWGLGMAPLPVQKGIINSVSGKTIIDLGGTWTNNQFSGGPVQYEIEITSSNNAGLVDVVSNTTASTTIGTLNDDSSMISSGNTYLIRQSWTLNTLFGTTASGGIQAAGFLGGTAQVNADNVSVWNPVTQQYAAYWFKTNGNQGAVGWKLASASTGNGGTNGLFIDQGILITRRAANSTNVLIVGAVKLGQTLSPIIQQAAPGLTFAANVYPASFALTNSGLFSGLDSTGVRGGTAQANADNVSIWNPANQQFAAYWYKTNSNQGGAGWRLASASTINAGNTNLAIGQMILLKRTVSTPFNWFMQQPFTQ
jgi:hypothetical protein